MCFSTLILSGIRTIVYGYEDVMGGGTRLNLDELPPLYADMKVTVVPACAAESVPSLSRIFSVIMKMIIGKTPFLLNTPFSNSLFSCLPPLLV